MRSLIAWLMSMGSKDAKSELRTVIRGRLKGLSADYLVAQSAAACERLMATEAWASARSIACYCSMSRELQTASLLSAAFASGKTVFLPRVESLAERHMVMLRAESMADIGRWPRSKWGIPEPPGVRPDALDCGDLDLVVVPGLAFDEACRRLGQGAGFYDTWLAALPNPKPKLVALALDEQLFRGDGALPVDPHDVPLDAVVSPSVCWHRSTL